MYPYFLSFILFKLSFEFIPLSAIIITFLIPNLFSSLSSEEGNSLKTFEYDPNNSCINPVYDPHDIDNPIEFKPGDGFIGFNPWYGKDANMYMQEHPVIPSEWGKYVKENKNNSEPICKYKWRDCN
jgi:hypothetical protein